MRGKIVQKHELLLNRIFPARGARMIYCRPVAFSWVAACGDRNGELRASAGGGCGPPDSSSRTRCVFCWPPLPALDVGGGDHEPGEWRPPRGGGVGRATRRVAGIFSWTVACLGQRLSIKHPTGAAQGGAPPARLFEPEGIGCQQETLCVHSAGVVRPKPPAAEACKQSPPAPARFWCRGGQQDTQRVWISRLYPEQRIC